MKKISWGKVLVWVVIGGGALYLFAFLYILFFAREASPEIFDGEALVRIGKHEFIAEVADTEEERARGLSGRDSLDEMRGMLFLFDSPAGGPEVQSFWMKDMKFPIDIIWVRKGGVIGADRNLPLPVSGAALSGLPMYVSPGPVNAVLEVRAGTVEALEIRAGDKFSF